MACTAAQISELVATAVASCVLAALHTPLFLTACGSLWHIRMSSRPELPALGGLTVEAGLQAAVLNALDAGASRIAISYDPLRQAVVEDNGAGLSPEQMQLSALQRPEALGRSLAALASAGWLEVTSKARGSFETHSFCFDRGRLQRQGLALEQRTKTGTLVTIRWAAAGSAGRSA